LAFDRDKVQQQADKLVAAGKIEAGIAQYQLLVGDNPRDLGTLNKIGDLYVRLNKKSEAIKTFMRIAEIYADDGFFLKAIAIYKKINKINPTHLETIQRLADLYAKQGLKTEARAQYLIVAESFMKAGQADKAISAYEMLASLEPENIKHRLALAEMKMKHGKSEDAARSLVEIAQDLDRKGMIKESARIYEMALAASRGDAGVAAGLCAALAASSQHEKALSILEPVLKHDPRNAALLAVKGDCLAAVGKAGEAVPVLRLALSQEPGRVDASLVLARVLISRREEDGARQAVSGALDGIIASGKGPEAVKLLETILGIDRDSREALEDLYRLHTLLGNKAGVLSAGERLVQVFTDQGRHSEALALAKGLAELEPASPAHRDRVQRLIDQSEGRGDRPTGPQKAETPAARPATVAEVPEASEERFEETFRETPATEVDAEERLEPVSAGEAGAEPTLTPEDEEFISEHLTEADVFVKYGLADRAVEQLNAIVDRFPWHIPARQRLRDVYMEEGNRARAANEAAALGKILIERGDRIGAAAALEEARGIEDSCPAIAEVEAMLDATAGARAARPAPPRVAPARRPEPEPAEFVIEEEEAVDESEPVAAASPSKAPPQQDVEEFDFYLSQGMRSEAAACLSRLEAGFGPHPDLESRRAKLGKMAVEAEAEDVEIEVARSEEGEVEEAEGAPEEVVEAAERSAAASREGSEEVPASGEPAAVPAAPPVAAEGTAAADFFDLASELDSTLFSAQEATEEESILAGLEVSAEGHSLEEIVSAFKKGIEQQVDSEDFETHYQLGIAYKEMGLTEEAIAEFQFASKDARLLPDCCSMLGICFKDKGMLPLAVKWYRKGLESLSAGGAGAGIEERLNGVRFDLADVFELMGEYRQAMDLFVEVYGVDSRYREVAARIKELEKRVAG